MKLRACLESRWSRRITPRWSVFVGFLAGMIVCPDLIQSSEWLPLVWGEEAPLLDSQDQAQSIIGLSFPAPSGRHSTTRRSKNLTKNSIYSI